MVGSKSGPTPGPDAYCARGGKTGPARGRETGGQRLEDEGREEEGRAISTASEAWGPASISSYFREALMESCKPMANRPAPVCTARSDLRQGAGRPAARAGQAPKVGGSPAAW